MQTHKFLCRILLFFSLFTHIKRIRNKKTLFNLPHLAFRVFGLFKGLDQGLGLIHVIQRYRLPDLAIRAKEATVVLLGGFLAFSTLTTTRAEGVMSGWGLLVLPVVALVTLLGRKGRSTLVVLLSGLAMIALLGPML